MSCVDEKVLSGIKSNISNSFEMFLEEERIRKHLTESDILYLGGLFEEASLFTQMGQVKKADFIWKEINDIIQSRKSAKILNYFELCN